MKPWVSLLMMFTPAAAAMPAMPAATEPAISLMSDSSFAATSMLSREWTKPAPREGVASFGSWPM